jgi:hypothetical protein
MAIERECLAPVGDRNICYFEKGDIRMALYIRDPEVDRLVGELQHMRKNQTKTEIIRTALQKQVEAEKAEMPLIDRVKALHARVSALGPRDPAFGMKTFSDELYDGM